MKQLVPIIAIALVAGLGLFMLVSRQRDEVSPVENSTTQKPFTPLSAAPADDKAKPSLRYVEYSTEVLKSSVGKRRVLFFFANWCPTCLPADTDFKANVDQIPEDTILIRVNYNDTDTDSEEKALAQKYGITYQHTFVQIDNNGAVVSKWNGGQTRELLTKLK